MKSSFMNTPLFSILIAQYNNGKYFEDCYKSIMAQSYTNWEAIIVDDCSTDDSLEQMKKLIGDDARFKIFSNDENKGCGFTKKKCIDNADGNICGFLDPDDKLTADAIEVMMIAHHKHPAMSLIYSNNFVCDKNLMVVKEKVSRIQQPKNISVIEMTCPFAFATFKKEKYLRSVQLNPEFKRAIDVDLYCCLDDVGDLLFIDKSLYYYRIHDEGISRGENRKKAEFWTWIVKQTHAKRKDMNIEGQFVKWCTALEYDLSRFSNLTLFKTVVSRVIFGIKK